MTWFGIGGHAKIVGSNTLMKLLRNGTVGVHFAAAGLGAISTMKVVQSEQRALLAEMRTELADEKRVRIENDIEHVKRQRELETQLSEAITRNDELAKEVVTLRGELTSMSEELEVERKARQKLARELETANKENAELRKRVQTLESKEVTSDKK